MAKFHQPETGFLSSEQKILTWSADSPTPIPEILPSDHEFLTLEALFQALNPENQAPNLQKDPPDQQNDLLEHQKEAPEG